MSTSYLDQLPSIASITKEDILLIQQEIGAQKTTYKTTVEQLLAAFVPVPAISEVLWDSGKKELTIQGTNLFPTTLCIVDADAYPIFTHENITQEESTINKVVLSLVNGLAEGEHEIVVKNAFIAEDSFSYTLEADIPQ